MVKDVNSKKIATLSVFAALTVALQPIKFPAPYATFLYYEVWEIPITAAFALYGPGIAIAIAILNTLVLLAIFPGALPTGPLYNLAAVLGMLLGMYVAHIATRRGSLSKRIAMLNLLATALGIVSRVVIMSLVNWVFLRYPPPIGFSIPEAVILGFLPLIGFFNATLALYTIPVGYMLARAVSHRIKIGIWKPK
jgi:riboflavin transporter FmnP